MIEEGVITHSPMTVDQHIWLELTVQENENNITFECSVNNLDCPLTIQSLLDIVGAIVFPRLKGCGNISQTLGITQRLKILLLDREQLCQVCMLVFDGRNNGMSKVGTGARDCERRESSAGDQDVQRSIEKHGKLKENLCLL
jgi:hypothetical protein